MEKEQLNRVRPGGAEEWKQSRLPRAAGNGKQFQSPEAEEKRSQGSSEELKRIYLLKLLALLMFAGAIVMFTTIAWFSMNKNVGTNGMGVTAAGMPFELAVAGDNVGALSYAQSGIAQSPVYTPSEIYGSADDGTTARALTNGTLQSGTYYTDGSNPKIKWRLTDAYSDKGLEPNSQGALSFSVIPKSSGTFDLKFSISMEGYTAEQSKNTNGSYDVEYISVIDDDSSADKKASVEYLKGHILFFSGREDVGTPGNPVYEYTGLLDPNEFTLSEVKGQTVTASAGTAIPVTIYWIWSNTFGQMVFSAEDNGGRIPVGYNSTTRDAIREYVVDHPTRIFDDLTELAVLNKLAEEENGEYTFDEDRVRAGTNFADLTLGYNKADQKIGTHVRYLLLILDAFH